MFRELFGIGSFQVHSFGAMMAAGFIAAMFLMDRLNKRYGSLPPSLDISSFLMWIIIGGIAGARLCHVVEYWRQDGFAGDPARIFKIWEGGLVFYGGFAGAAVAFFAFCRKYRKERSVADFSDLLLCGLPLGHAFGRIGCFLNGCCYGSRAEGALSWLGVSFPPLSDASYEQARLGLLARPSLPSLPVLPVQLFEAAFLLMLAALLVFLYAKTRKAGTAKGLPTGVYLFSYAAFRFLIEFLRGDDRPELGSLSSAQMFSIPLAAVGVWFFVRAVRSAARAEAATSKSSPAA